MAYSGSTAASSVANPPICILPGLSPTLNASGNVVGSSLQTTATFAGGNSLWRYTSSDATTLTKGVGYFTDGLALGMKNGDAIIIVEQSSLGTSPVVSMGVLITTNSTAGFNCASGGVITSS